VRELNETLLVSFGFEAVWACALVEYLPLIDPFYRLSLVLMYLLLSEIYDDYIPEIRLYFISQFVCLPYGATC